MDRRYFILERISPNELEALEACIGESWTQRYSLDGSQVLIKVDANFLAAQPVAQLAYKVPAALASMNR